MYLLALVKPGLELPINPTFTHLPRLPWLEIIDKLGKRIVRRFRRGVDLAASIRGFPTWLQGLCAHYCLFESHK